MRRPTVPAVLAACAAAVIAWTGAAGAATAAPTSSVAAPTGATVTAPAKPAAKTTTATYSHACSTAVAKGFAHCDALVRTDSRCQGRPAQRTARRLRPGRPAERVQAPDRDRRRRPDGRDRRRLRRPERRVRPGDLPLASTGCRPCTTANGCFKKVNQNGGTAAARGRRRLGREISLDVDMVSAVCPNCHILLVEADSAILRQPRHGGEHRGRAGRQVVVPTATAAASQRARRLRTTTTRASRSPRAPATAATASSTRPLRRT